MFSRFCTHMKKYWRYAFYSSRSSLKSEVANSYLNWLWWILDPLCFMMIYAFIFGYVFHASEPYFPVFIFIGITMWDFFNKSMVQSVKLVRQNKAIVSKVYLPKYVLLLVKWASTASKCWFPWASSSVCLRCGAFLLPGGSCMPSPFF